jgi:hypothetical protein
MSCCGPSTFLTPFVFFFPRATRGNIGLMCWSFALFLCGLMVITMIQLLLMLCSRLRRQMYPFSARRPWKILLGIGLYGSSASGFCAIGLLVVCVLDLRFDSSKITANGDETPTNGGGDHTPGDAPLLFDIEPRKPAIMAFSVSSSRSLFGSAFQSECMLSSPHV